MYQECTNHASTRDKAMTHKWCTTWPPHQLTNYMSQYVAHPYANSVYQSYASTNIPTMCLKQVSYHSWYASTKNQVPQSCILINEVSQLYHPYINTCTKHVLPLVPSNYINHAPIPQQDEPLSRCVLIHVCQIYHKTCANQTTSRFPYQCTRNVPIIHQL